MEELTKQDKSKVSQKFREFKLNGLISYGKYLANELEYSADKSNRKAYTKYIEKEIESNKKKVAKLEAKMV